MMRLLCAVLVLTFLALGLAVPAVAQDRPDVSRRPNETVVRYRGGLAGVRVHPNGTREEIVRGRWVRVSDLPPEAAPLRPGAEAAHDVAPPLTFDQTPVTLDIAILYTPRVLAERGSVENVEALAALAVDLSNQAYANSAVPWVQQRLVGVRLHNIVERDIQSDLLGLVFAYGASSALRVETGADLVALFGSGYTGQGYCGIGYLAPNSATYAASVIDHGCVSGLTVSHETGHNIGMHHNPEQVCGATVCAGYNYGHLFGSWGTVMAYGGNRLVLYSNPDVLYNGLPTGIYDQRDNARVLRENALRVSLFMPHVSTFPPSPATNLRAVL